jgi:superkiller protein 3
MKNIIIYSILCLLCGTGAYAQKKTFVRDYTYQAGEADSILTARANATTQLRNILLREVGEFLHTERTVTQDIKSQDYAEKIEAITAGIVEMKTLDEQWDGATYYIKAEMTVDPKDLERRIAEVLNDKQKTKDLEEARKRVKDAEAEIERLKKELVSNKDNTDLKASYQKQTDALAAEEYFTKGYSAQENGFNELAIEYYQQAIDIDPNYVKAYYNMGVVYYDMGRHDQLKNFREELGNFHEAIRYFQKAIDLDPKHAMAYYTMGSSYFRLGRHSEAIRYIQKAIDLDPKHAIAYRDMGKLHSVLKDYNEAIRYYQKAIAINPNYAWAYIYMGDAYKDLQDYNEAIRCYQNALDIDPNLVADYAYSGVAEYAYSGMERAYSGLNKTREFKRYLKNVAQLGNEDAQKFLRKMGW